MRKRISVKEIITIDENYDASLLIYNSEHHIDDAVIKEYTYRGKSFATISFPGGNEFLNDINDFANAIGFDSGFKMLLNPHVRLTLEELKDRSGVWAIYGFNLYEVKYGNKMDFKAL